MYLALAHFKTKKHGPDLDRMKKYVDTQNETTPGNKYCLIELNENDWCTYNSTKGLFGCHPDIIYDPYNVATSIIKSLASATTFTRVFGGKGKD